MPGALDKIIERRKTSKVIKIPSNPTVSEQDIENEIEGWLNKGYNLVSVSVFANNVWAFFTKVEC